MSGTQGIGLIEPERPLIGELAGLKRVCILL